MNLKTILRRGRTLAERLMTDRCTVSVPDGVTVDPDTGVSAPNRSEVYSGVCKVQSTAGTRSDSETGTMVEEWGQRVDFPWNTKGLHSDMLVSITSSDDASLVGRRFRLTSPESLKTYATAQRWNAKAVE